MHSQSSWFRWRDRSSLIRFICFVKLGASPALSFKALILKQWLMLITRDAFFYTVFGDAKESNRLLVSIWQLEPPDGLGKQGRSIGVVSALCIGFVNRLAFLNKGKSVMNKQNGGGGGGVGSCCYPIGYNR